MARNHRRKRTLRWKSASALVLVPLLISTSGGTLAGTAEAGSTVIPRIPSRPFDQPASVQAAVAISASPKAKVAKVAHVATSDIPATAFAAYIRTETLLADSDPKCKLPWNLVAAIGRVESNHGRTGGNSLNDDGVAKPGIYGIALNGSKNTATISDTDSGKFDRDSKWDRAVGPMQFIPATWTSVAIDSDVDGKSDPQNIYDATAAAGVYLCAGLDDLSTDRGARNAVRRYNHSDAYVDLVLALAKQYAKGDFTDSPSYVFAGPLHTFLAPPLAKEKNKVKDETPGEKSKQGTTKPATSGDDPNSGPKTDPATGPVEQEPTVPAEEEPSTPPVEEEPAAAPPETAPPTVLPKDVPPTVVPPKDVPPTVVPPKEVPVPPAVPPKEDPPVVPPAALPEAQKRCLDTGAYTAGSKELQVCVAAVMKTGKLP